MATAEQHSESILPSLAQHEKTLLAKREAATEEAQEIVDQAKTEARKHALTEESKLIEDVAKIRADAQAKREQAFERTVQEAEAQLVSVREEALSRVSATVEKVLALLLPPSAKGGAS